MLHVYLLEAKMNDPVSEEDAALFAALLKGAIDTWLDKTGRDEIPEELARKTLEKMDEVTQK